jgi:hypothetical protein
MGRASMGNAYILTNMECVVVRHIEYAANE